MAAASGVSMATESGNCVSNRQVKEPYRQYMSYWWLNISKYRYIVFEFRYIVSYRIVEKDIDFFDISRYFDNLIDRDIFGIIIGANTCPFLRQTFKAFSVFVISTFSGNFVQWTTENRVVINRTALRVTQTHFYYLNKAYFLAHVWSLFVRLYILYTHLLNTDIVSISQYLVNILSISYRNWNPDIESSLLDSNCKRKNIIIALTINIMMNV